MSIATVKQYLEKIAQGKSVNYPKFKRVVESNTPYELGPKTVQIKKEKGDLYRVKFLSDEVENALKRLAGLDSNSRVSLATQNKSHSQKVSGSIINCRRGAKHPYVVLFDQDGNYQSPHEYGIGTDCLIIENLENFLSIENTLSFLEAESILDPNKVSDIIFADGKAVTNSLHRNFLNEFNRVFLLLDLDLGGLDIAASIKHLIPETEVNFLVAPSSEIMLSNVIACQKPEYLKKVDAIGQKHKFLSAAANLILKHRKTIEQEAYLQ